MNGRKTSRSIYRHGEIWPVIFLFSNLFALHSLLTAQERPLPVSYLHGPTLTHSGSTSSNPCLNNTIEAFNSLHDHGQTLGFHWGADYPDVWGAGTSNHWQGIQRLPLMGLNKPYLVVSSSHRHRVPFEERKKGNNTPAHFAVVEMGSRPADSGRLRSNRLAAGKLTRYVVPDSLDRIVKAVAISPEFVHAGAMQALGKYILVGADDHMARQRATSLLTLWDMSNPHQPQNLWQGPNWELPGKIAGSVGLVQLANGQYLLLRALQDAKQLEFYLLDANIERNPAAYHDGAPWAKWDYRELQSELYTKDGFLDRQWADLNSFVGSAGYQNTNLVAECGSGTLYLVASHGRRPSGFGGADRIDLYRVEVPAKRPAPNSSGQAILTKVARRQLYPAKNSGAQQGDLQAGAGVYISPDNRLYFYATEHGVTGRGGFVSMIEFAPTVKSGTVSSLARAWLTLYEHPNHQGRSIFLDYADRDLRDYDHLQRIELFDNRASSAIFALPKGHTLRLYNQTKRRGGFIDLVGSGKVESIEDFGPMLFSDGQLVDNQISSLAWKTNPQSTKAVQENAAQP